MHHIYELILSGRHGWRNPKLGKSECSCPLKTHKNRLSNRVIASNDCILMYVLRLVTIECDDV
jgi:hypothetical protein